ncbi:MAG TPA: hypothetical protein VEQ38_15055 [Verrucomicrobiae bacterium]|nr:hypothetical protein [Verrucomicrobiae bacterium]
MASTTPANAPTDKRSPITMHAAADITTANTAVTGATTLILPVANP